MLMLFSRVFVALEERAVVHVNERPVAYLGPGRHWVWHPFRKLEVLWLKTDALVASLKPEQLALVPEAELARLQLGPGERALVRHRGRPVRWLGPGEHQVWTVDRVAIEVIDVSAAQVAPLRDEVKAIVPSSEYVEATVPEGAVALRHVDGAIDAVLGPGRYAAWNVVRKVQLPVVDLRERVIQVTGQEVMTRDRVTLRLNLSLGYRVADPKRLATVAREADQVVYLAMQLAAREAVSGSTLDQLLAERQALSGTILAEVVERAAAVGLEVLTFGLKDVILPGEMKVILNRVIEAQKEAEANVILRREETAATRSLAQTAKVLSESPILVRLKELEAYKDLASRVGQVHLVLGEGTLPKIELKAS